MSFYVTHQKYRSFDWAGFFRAVTPERVARIIRSDQVGPQDFLALLAPAAEKHLEAMAVKAARLTRQHFGRTVTLYAPLYLSNYCTNRCLYCGFSTRNALPRRQLNLAEVAREAAIIRSGGIQQALILTGDAPAVATVDYIAACVQVLKQYFPFIAMEVYALSAGDYSRLQAAGVDALTLYQETYNEEIYAELHPEGPKRDFRFRLAAPERAGEAGLRAINIGALLGLDDWRRDAFFTGLHADYLQRRYPAVEVSISLPRVRPEAGGFTPAFPVADRHLVQYLTAFRLFMPRAGITISTREDAFFRDRLVKLGVTRLSAGSCTVVGGYGNRAETAGQFAVADQRDVTAVAAAVAALGYQPVFQDWHRLDGPAGEVNSR